MEKKQLELRHFFKLPNRGLRAYLGRVKRGNAEDYRTPFYNGAPRHVILDNWMRILDNLQCEQHYPGLFEYEMEMKEKVGPLSFMKPLEDRLPDIENYYLDIENPGKPLSEDSIQACIDWLKPIRGIRKRSIDATIDNMRLNTNSGNPYFTRRSKVVTLTTKALKNGADIIDGYPNIAVLG